MRINTIAAVLFVFACAASGITGGQAPSGSGPSQVQLQPMTYEAFMAVETPKRSEVFATLTPENKSALKRAHAEAWLARNRQRLSTKQIAAVQEAIAFLSPELYRQPAVAEMRVKEGKIRQQLECTLNRSDVIEAFTFLTPGPAPTFSERVDEWLSWFGDCVVGGRK